MDLVTMILACSLYNDNSIANAMAQVGSQNNPLTVTVEEGETKTFPDPQQATQFVIQEMQRGHTVDIGLMQIPSFWLKQFAANTHIEELFLPCRNMVLATKILNAAEEKCAQIPSTAVSDLQTCALSIYKTNDETGGTAYAHAVLDYAASNSFHVIKQEAEAKNPAGFHMIPGDAPTTSTTKDAASINPATDKTKLPLENSQSEAGQTTNTSSSIDQ
jgi:hypothetical protein